MILFPADDPTRNGRTFPMLRLRAWPLRYGLAFVTVAVAILLLRIPEYGRGLASLFFFAVLLSSWFGGIGPGLLATALTATTGIVMVYAFTGGFQKSQVLGVLTFIAGGILITLLVEALHAARRKAEASQAWLAAALSSIGDGVIATDGEGRVSLMNPIAEALTGWKQAEAFGQPLEDVFPIFSERTRKPVENPVVRVLREGIIVGLANHTLLIGRDGLERPIDDSAAPIKDERGTIVGVILVFRDNTERRLAEKALQESEARHRTMVEQVKEYAIFTLDPEGRVTGWNGGVERVLGFSEAEFVGQPIARIFLPEDVARGVPEAELRTAAQEGQTSDDRWQVRKDGRRFWASGITTALHDDQERLIGYSKVLRDLTDRKLAEEERNHFLAREQAARAEAEAANLAKDHFLAVLSHELRTPLTPVLMTVTAMLDDPATSAEFRPTLEMTRHHVTLEARLIDDLLDVTRIMRGKLKLDQGVVDAHSLILRAVDICREEVQAARHELTLDLAAEERRIDVDPVRLQQVFWNLIKNAVKFTRPGGKIMIRTRNETVHGHDGPENRLRIEVSDTGIGIEPDLLPRIFDAFEQGDASSWTRRAGGLGLGLAISRSIIEAHGGQLTAASPGAYRGSTFIIDLQIVPAPEAAPAEAPDPSPESPLRAGLRILLVEDDETTLRVMARLLRDQGYTVMTAHNLATGLQIGATEDFDLVISDIGLPDGNGLELMRKLKELRAVKGIALSGFGMDHDLMRSKDAGFVAHLTKPIDFRKLEAMIQQVSS